MLVASRTPWAHVYVRQGQQVMGVPSVPNTRVPPVMMATRAGIYGMVSCDRAKQ